MLEAPLPHRVSLIERYDKERTAAFGALTEAIEAVADKITDGQYKAIYDAAMTIYHQGTPPERVRTMALDAESLSQVASAAATAMAAQPVVQQALEQLHNRDQRERVRAYEREAVNAMQAARSPDPIEAEWGAMWIDQVDEGYGGPHILRRTVLPSGGTIVVGGPMPPRGVQQAVRRPTARDALAYHRVHHVVRRAQGATPPRSSGDALASYARYIRNNEPPPPLIGYPGDGSHTLPPRYTGEDSEIELVD